MTRLTAGGTSATVARVAALLECEDARIDVAGSPAVDGLTLRTTGEHVLVLGAARALFEAAAGMRAVARGTVRIAGEPATAGVHAGAVAGAPLDPPMPPAWTVREYATWSARLAGHPKKTARALAEEALGRTSLESSAQVRLAQAPLVVRRGVVVAAALATGARVILLDDSMAALPDDLASALGRVLGRALGDRRTIVFAPRLPLASPLALAADEAIVVAGAHVAAQGAPAEIASRSRGFALRVHGDARVFAERAAARGATITAAPNDVTPAHVTLDLGPLSTTDLFALAAEAHAVIVELVPVARGFA
jgi:ABC-type multidrug transport system ATPase subunit